MNDNELPEVAGMHPEILQGALDLLVTTERLVGDIRLMADSTPPERIRDLVDVVHALIGDAVKQLHTAYAVAYSQGHTEEDAW